jgi:hypothetical protein
MNSVFQFVFKWIQISRGLLKWKTKCAWHENTGTRWFTLTHRATRPCNAMNQILSRFVTLTRSFHVCILTCMIEWNTSQVIELVPLTRFGSSYIAIRNLQSLNMHHKFIGGHRCQSSRVGTVPSPWAGLRVNISVEKPHMWLIQTLITIGLTPSLNLILGRGWDYA